MVCVFAAPFTLWALYRGAGLIGALIVFGSIVLMILLAVLGIYLITDEE